MEATTFNFQKKLAKKTRNRLKLALLLMASLAALAQDRATQTTSHIMNVTLVSVQRMTVGEAYDCPSIDVQWSEA